MSAAHILNILQHHDQPCALLERLVPRFMPFELDAVLMAQAHSLAVMHPRIYASLLYAFCNALTDTFHWSLPARMATPHTDPSITQCSYMSIARHPPYRISLEFYQSLVKSTLILCHLPHIKGLEHMLVLSIPFVRYIKYPEQRTPPEELRKLYAYSICERLTEQGLTELPEDVEHDLKILTSHEHILMSIPLATATTHIKALHDMLANQDIVAHELDKEGALIPGPLALQAARRLGLENHDLAQWLDGSLRSYDVDDIPF